MRSRHGSLETGPTTSDSTESLLAAVSVQSKRLTTLSGFIKQDVNFRRQRRVLFELQTKRMVIPFSSRVQQRKAIKEVTGKSQSLTFWVLLFFCLFVVSLISIHVVGPDTLNAKVIREISTLYDHPRKKSLGPMEKFNTLLKLKKVKKRSFSGWSLH